MERKVYFTPDEFAQIQTSAAQAGLSEGSWISRAAAQAAQMHIHHQLTDWERLAQIATVLAGIQTALDNVAKVIAHAIEVQQRTRTQHPATAKALEGLRIVVQDLERTLAAVRAQIA